MRQNVSQSLLTEMDIISAIGIDFTDPILRCIGRGKTCRLTIFAIWEKTAFFYMCDQADTVTPYHTVSTMDFVSAGELFWDDDFFEHLAKTSRFTLPKSCDVSLLGFESNQHYYQGQPECFIEDIDLLLSIIRSDYPEDNLNICCYLAGKELVPSAIFCMDKPIVDEFCTWLFDILDRFLQLRDTTLLNHARLRAPVVIAELLFGVFVYKHRQRGEAPLITELSSLTYLNVAQSVCVRPAFSKNNIPIVLASSNYYTPYCATLIQSIMNHASHENGYDIIILSRDMDKLNSSLLLKILHNRENISVRVVNPDCLLTGKNFIAQAHFTIESYFRSTIPYILPLYDKVLYLDCDMVAMADIAPLFLKTDVTKYLIAAINDPLYAAIAGSRHDQWLIDYIEKSLRFSLDAPYFNAGVMVMNTALYRKMFTLDYTLQKSLSFNYLWCDQDVFNILCRELVLFIDQKWNLLADTTGYLLKNIISAPPSVNLSYMEARKEPCIIHYADRLKPWSHESADMTECFWEVARQTPFYEIILNRMSYEILKQQAQQAGIAIHAPDRSL